MSHGKKYWLSPQRGLPRPTGRLAGAIDAPEMGAFEEPWPEEEARYQRRPAPRYLQSQAESLDEIQQAARIQRFLQQAGARTQWAYGPGAAGGLPPVDSQAGGEAFGAAAGGFPAGFPAASGHPLAPGDTDAGLPLIAKPHGPQQIYGASFAPQARDSLGAHDAGLQAGGLGGGLAPGLRAPFDDVGDGGFAGGDIGGGDFPSGLATPESLTESLLPEPGPLDAPRLPGAQVGPGVPGPWGRAPDLGAAGYAPAGPEEGRPLGLRGPSDPKGQLRSSEGFLHRPMPARHDVPGTDKKGGGGATTYWQNQARRDWLQQLVNTQYGAPGR